MLMKEFEIEKPNFDQPSQYNPFPQLVQQDRIRMYSGWLQEIRKQAGFKYTPLPDEQGRSRPVSSEDSAPMPADRFLTRISSQCGDAETCARRQGGMPSRGQAQRSACLQFPCSPAAAHHESMPPWTEYCRTSFLFVLI